MVIAVAIIGAVVAIVHQRPFGGETHLASQYTYDLDGNYDPKLLLYRQVAAFDTGMGEVVALAMGQDDQICVAGDHAIKVFDPAGDTIRDIPLEGEPSCVHFDRAGARMYVGLANRIAVYDAQGKLLANWKEIAKDSYFTSIAVRGQDLFVGDPGRHVVVHLDSQGKVIGEIGRKDENAGFGGFIVPSLHMDMAIDHEGMLRVANPGCHEVETFTLDGKYQADRAWGNPGSGIEAFTGCCNPTNFAIMADGSFVTSEKGLPRVKLYSPQGKFVGVVAGPKQFARSRYDGDTPGIGLGVTTGGTICVLDPFSRQVRLFAPIKK
jgi:hypothetical protein